MLEFAKSVIDTLRRAGHEAYLVGGCVRDLVLGREPADYDVATDATPDEVMRIFPNSYGVGAQFGVVLVAPPDGLGASSAKNCVEVATYRSDIGYSDGRHPDRVQYSKSARDDVQRRDFTINGLLYDTVADQVLDFVGGLADIKAGVIRTIGSPEQRFREDKLRLMRAVRFAARFEYRIDPQAFAAIQELAGAIREVSQERIRDELTKMLTEGHAKRAFVLLDESRLLRQVLPEISAMKGVEQPPEFHPEGDVFLHTLLLLDKLPQPCPRTLAWGALLHDVGKPATFRVAPDRIRFDGHVEVGVRMAERICERLRFSNQDTEQIMALVANHMRFADVRKMKPSTLKRFLRLRCFEEHLELHRLDCLSSHADLGNYDYAREQFQSLPADEIRPKPLVTGHDLIAAGYKPGPRFKEILTAVEDGQLEGRFSNKDAAMEFVEREFPAARSD